MVVRITEAMPYAGLKSCQSGLEDVLMQPADATASSCGPCSTELAVDCKRVQSDALAALSTDLPNMEDSPVLPLLARALDDVVETFEQQLHELQGDCITTVPRATVFHGLRAPPISIEAYMVRIAKYVKCSPVCFVQSFIYIKRLAQKDIGLRPTSLNVHRLLLTGVLLAAKFMDDRYYNNAFYAKVGGIAMAELNRLELAMLKLLDYRLLVSLDEVALLLKQLQAGSSVLLEADCSMDACAVVMAGMPCSSGVAAAGRLKRRSCNDGDMDGECRRQHRRSSTDAGHDVRVPV